MQPTKFGAVLSFILTIQFLLTLAWILVAWPAEGLAGLTDAMAEYFRARIDQPFSFAVLNLYNVSFALSASALAVVIRRQFLDFQYLGDFMMLNVAIAAAMYVASGIVPLVAAPPLHAIGDESALNAIEGVGAGLLLGATMASGFAVITVAVMGLMSKRLPFFLCLIVLSAGIIELIEWAVPTILILDPLLGSVWSVWLGVLFLQGRVAHVESARQHPLTGDEALT